MNRICMELLEQRQVPVLYGWVYILTILTVLVTVYLSLVKPMRMAAKISPVEAMRYQGEIREKKKERKGFAEMSLVKLTRSNLSRNKKRSILTIVTLGAVGILFMAVATVLSCADPEEIAKQEFEGDYEIAVDSWEGDKMNPDRAWVNLAQNNPLNGDLVEQIRAVDGVEEVKVKTYLTGTLADLDPEREIASASIQGLDESYREIVENCQIEGAVTWEELEEKDSEDKNLVKWILICIASGIVIMFILFTVATDVIMKITNVVMKVSDTTANYTTNLPFAPAKKNILLIGTDSNGAGTDPFVGVRSDTLVVININPRSKNVNLLSIPRDSKVSIKGHGIDKINSAFAHGGPELTIKTIEKTLGIKIDYYIVFNYDSVKKLVTALGGVPVYVEKDMYYTDRSGGLSV